MILPASLSIPPARWGFPLVLISLLTGPALGLLTEVQRTDISDFVSALVECRNVSGLALGIVFGDGNNEDDVFTAGFGYSDRERNLNVTNSTQFALGSLSTTFTTTLVSKLLHGNKNKYPDGWDTTVKEVLGRDFKLSDPLRTEYTTLRDLAAHKTGYPHYQSLMGGLSHSVKRSEYCSRYFLLKPKYEFRGDFHFSKEMFTLLGCVAEVLGGGTSLEELVTSYLFNPLQMTSSSFVNATDNLAVPHVYNNGSFLPLDSSLLRAIYPNEAAEGVVSTAEDMVKWLHYHLLHVANMSQIQEGQVLEQTYLPQVQYKLSKMTEFEPQSRVKQVVFAHNLGWESGQYRSYRFIQQSGRLSGFTSKVVVFRDISLGIFISMNSGSSKIDTMTTDIITWHIADLLLIQRPPLFFSPENACMHEYPFAHEGILVPGPMFSQPRRPTASIPTRTTTTTPAPKQPQWETAYLGTYGHQTFGNITISYDSMEDALTYKTGVVGSGMLQNAGKEDMFLLKFRGPLSYMHKMFPDKNITFYFEKIQDGQFTALQVQEDQLEYQRSVRWDLPNSVQSLTQRVGIMFTLLVLQVSLF